MSTWAKRLGVFDLETTGVDVETARIVTAHVGVIEEAGDASERNDWLLNPGVTIPEQATAVHGITTEHARERGQSRQEGVAEIVAMLRGLFAQGLPVVAYNAPYDFTLLDRECRRLGLEPLDDPRPVVDPLVVDRAVDKYRKGKRTLSVTAAFYGVALTDAHDAGADAIAAGRVAQAIARAHGERLALTADALHEAQVGWCREQAEDFQAYMRRVRDPEFTTSGDWPVRRRA